MKETIGAWKPINENPEFHDGDLDIGSLRLEEFLARDWREVTNEGEHLLALTDGWGRICPRERALILIERLLAFYVSITDEQIENYNVEIEGHEGGKTGLRLGLDRTLLRNRRAMGIVDQSSDEKSVPEK